MSAQQLEQTHYDAVIIGTGLTESILAGALAKASRSVLHLDANDYYGSQWASLTLEELVRWASAAGGGGGEDGGGTAQSGEGDGQRTAGDDERRRDGIADISYRFFPSSNAKSNAGAVKAAAAAEAEVKVEGGAEVGQAQTNAPGSAAIPPELQRLSRHYSLSLAPTLLPSIGPLIDVMIASGVARYSTFRLLDGAAVWSPSTDADADVENGREEAASGGGGSLRKVPASKEDVFKSSELSLVEKRRLMKFLMWAGKGEWDDLLQGNEQKPFKTFLADKFQLEGKLTDAIAFAIAHCFDGDEPTAQALPRVQTHLTSVGRYGNSAYLVGQYGGAGEVAQGFCRTCAVFGGTYILNHRITSLSASATAQSGEATTEGQDEKRSYTLTIDGIEQKVTTPWVIGSTDLLRELLPTDEAPGVPMTEEVRDGSAVDLIRAIIVLDRPIPLISSRPTPASNGSYAEGGGDSDSEKQDGSQAPLPPETGLFLFPPGTVGRNERAVSALMMGEGTFSCPKDQYVLYLTTFAPRSGSSAEDILRPVLNTLLALAAKSPSSSAGAGAGTAGFGDIPEPLFELFYRQSQHGTSQSLDEYLSPRRQGGILTVPFPPPPAPARISSAARPPSSGTTGAGLTQISDHAAVLAERLFWHVVGRPENDRWHEAYVPPRYVPPRRRGDDEENPGGAAHKDTAEDEEDIQFFSREDVNEEDE